MANSVDPDQTAPIGAVCSGSTLFASILNSSVMLGNYLQQTTWQTTFSEAFFSWHLRAKSNRFYGFIMRNIGVPDSPICGIPPWSSFRLYSTSL